MTYTISTKIWNSTDLFNIDNNKKCFFCLFVFKLQISFAVTGKQYILKYTEIENRYFKL